MIGRKAEKRVPSGGPGRSVLDMTLPDFARERGKPLTDPAVVAEYLQDSLRAYAQEMREPGTDAHDRALRVAEGAGYVPPDEVADRFVPRAAVEEQLYQRFERIWQAADGVPVSFFYGKELGTFLKSHGLEGADWQRLDAWVDEYEGSTGSSARFSYVTERRGLLRKKPVRVVKSLVIEGSVVLGATTTFSEKRPLEALFPDVLSPRKDDTFRDVLDDEDSEPKTAYVFRDPRYASAFAAAVGAAKVTGDNLVVAVGKGNEARADMLSQVVEVEYDIARRNRIRKDGQPTIRKVLECSAPAHGKQGAFSVSLPRYLLYNAGLDSPQLPALPDINLKVKRAKGNESSLMIEGSAISGSSIDVPPGAAVKIKNTAVVGSETPRGPIGDNAANWGVQNGAAVFNAVYEGPDAAAEYRMVCTALQRAGVPLTSSVVDGNGFTIVARGNYNPSDTARERRLSQELGDLAQKVQLESRGGEKGGKR